MQEHDELGQGIIDLCAYVSAHADDWHGRAMAISPVFGTAVGAAVVIVRLAPIVWKLRGPIGALLGAFAKKEK